MEIKIKTPFGYLCLEDERMADNAKVMYAGIYEEKELNAIVVEAPEVKNAYAIPSPFGCGYTKHFERVLATRRSVIKMCGGKVERDITFVKAH